MKKLVPDPPHLLPYLNLSKDLSAEAARAEATTLMTCLREVFDLYFSSENEAHRHTLIIASLYLSQLLYPLIRRETGAEK